MLKRAYPVQYDKAVTQGRTNPSLITCELADETSVEVVAKFSASCEQGSVHLAREVIAACLAADLGLPIPEPFLVEVSTEWAATVPDNQRRATIHASSPVAFGSKFMGNQFSVWGTGNVISDAMLPTAAAIFVFDAIVQNPDRRPGNPNCLVRGDALRIIDHELAFSHGLVLGWRPPWLPDGLKQMEGPSRHIFSAGLKGRAIDYLPIRAAWSGLSDDRVAQYEAALPAEWVNVGAAASGATKLIRDARDLIDNVLKEVKRVLT